MRIGVLVLAAGRDAGGPETYEIEITRALARIDKKNEYVIYCPNEKAHEAIGINESNFTFRVLRPSLRVASLTVSLPHFLKKDRIDVLHATYAAPPLPPPRMVFTCHGLVNFLFPKFFPRTTRMRLNWLQKVAIRRSSRIICVSEHALLQLREHMHVPPERVTLAHHGVSSQFVFLPRDEARSTVESRFGLNGPYILNVGKIQEVKNIERLIHAFRRFKEATGSEVKLVLAGKSIDEMPSVNQLIAENGIVKLGYVQQHDLPSLYRAAEMFVFPSLFESFGLPALEAMTCGTPVIASTAGALPEICGKAAHFVDPYSVEAIADGMGCLYRSPERREQLIEQGRQHASKYSWLESARLTLETYRQALGGSAV